jgi:flagellar biosynthesis/type III secretory pathway chaperone
MSYFNERWNHLLDLAEECEQIINRNGVTLIDKNEREIGQDFSEGTIKKIEETRELLKLTAALVRSLEKLMDTKHEPTYYATLTESIEQIVCGETKK